MTSEPAAGRGRTILESLCLHRPELRGWVMYDWANSAMVTVIITAVFPVYYSAVANAGEEKATATARLAVATTIGLAIIAVLAPVLGALADYSASKKKMLAAFISIGVVGTLGLFFVGEGDWLYASFCFILANVGAGGSFVFYDSLLPHVAREDEMDRVSTMAYAMGYLGGGLLLAANLVWIQYPPEWLGSDETLPSRLAFLSVAVWWAGFSLPLFISVPEPMVAARSQQPSSAQPIRIAIARLAETFGELKAFKHAFLFLIAFLIYNDGIGTIYRMAVAYGSEIGIKASLLIGAILMVQFVGIPFAIGFGWLAGKIGTKNSIFLALAVYIVITLLGYLAYHFHETQASNDLSVIFFFGMGLLVAMVQGGGQALSRSLFASMIPRHKSTEFFGFFAVLEKFAGILGPGVFALVVFLFGSSKNAIVAVAGFFVIGAVILRKVDVAAGQAAARRAEELSEFVRPVRQDHEH